MGRKKLNITPEEKKERTRKYMKEYMHERGKLGYYKTEATKIRRRKYQSTERAKELRKKYRGTESFKRIRAKYKSTDKYKQYVKLHKYKRNNLKCTVKGYGLSYEKYLQTIAAQNGRCAACGGTNKENKRLHIDHSHDTGLFRGLLCFNCNAALGQVGDNLYRLIKLVDYIYERGE